uniref:Fe2OG dioxygenase domain-containing protein n=1 Tax=viral metagenome TaxID=1070528 RepID=A0A6C0LXX5_9ZZZZ
MSFNNKTNIVNDNWKYWIYSKINQGYSKKQISKTLQERNFQKSTIEKELNLILKEECYETYTEDDKYLQDIPELPKKHKTNINKKKVNTQKSKETISQYDPFYQLFIPNATKIDTNKAQVFEVENFMNEIECEQMINIMKRTGYRKSTFTKSSGKNYEDNYRNSSTCDFNKIKAGIDLKVVQALENRISKMLGINSSYSEPIQGQYYEVGQQFKQHCDFISENEKHKDNISKVNGNRSWTFMIYLNDVEEGGETHLINLNYKCKPKMGKALIWNNLDKFGKGNYNTLHAGLPPTKGEKYIITKWFREKGNGPKFIRSLNDMLPNYHPIGFEKQKLPLHLLEILTKWYDNNLSKKMPEPLDGGFLQNPSGTATDMINLDYGPEIKQEMNRVLQPIFEKWAGQKLDLKAIYGVRSFRRNSSLKPYCDTRDTHVISAVIHLGDKSDEPWAFEIVDNYYNKHNIYFEQGDLFLYEGARCVHGRPSQYKGDDWRVIYVHYSPKNWINIVKDRINVFQNNVISNQPHKRNINFNKKEKNIQTITKQPIIEVIQDIQDTHHFYNLFMPNAKKYPSEKLQLYELDNFMNELECNKMLEIINSLNLRPSTITYIDNKPIDNNFRTSSTCDLGNIKSSEYTQFIKDLEYRMGKILGINPNYSEGIQVQKYTAGQQFKHHHDWFGKDEQGYENIVKNQGNRSWTFMVYLNTTPKGGETEIVSIGKKFKPIRGKALIWNNLNKDGSGNFDTLHAGVPIIEGEKYIITKWFREKGPGPKFCRTLHDMLPNYHSIGFEKKRVPKELFSKIKQWYKDNLKHEKPEPLDNGFLQNPSGTASDIVSLDMSPELKNDIDKVIKPIFEEWSKLKLKTTAMYGIRTYRRDSSLKMHCDRPQTHVISAIIHVEDDSEESWPLKIVDNYYREHDIFFEEGDLVMYESSRCMHGRPTKYKGNRWSNMYIHYSPDNWKLIVDDRSKLPHN